MCKTIAIANQKGGVGKSITTVNLGAGLECNGQILKEGRDYIVTYNTNKSGSIGARSASSFLDVSVL